MLLSHAVLLAEARSYVAALADNAGTLDGSMEYERVLLQLDGLHGGGPVPPISEVLTDKRDVLYTVAEAAIEDLLAHGVEALEVELVLSMLAAARDVDGSS
jgi:hypothetical protein